MTHPSITLSNGVQMPQLGLGVWQTKNGDEVEAAVAAAIDAGYRLIDTAAVYGNEHGVGQAIARSSVPREELFITTKVWNADQGYHKTLRAFHKSLKHLGLDYVDLYLIHWPAPALNRYRETWLALEELYRDGRVRAIGVSNFLPEHLDNLMAEATVNPMINQIELHPHFPQLELRQYCQDNGIAVESYSPLGGSHSELLRDPLFAAIGERYQKTPAQVIIRWHLQQGLIVIPKSSHPDRIVENGNVFDFVLSDDDMARISALEVSPRVGADPATANFTINTTSARIAHGLGLSYQP